MKAMQESFQRQAFAAFAVHTESLRPRRALSLSQRTSISMTSSVVRIPQALGTRASFIFDV